MADVSFPPLSIAQRALAIVMVLISEPDAFGVAPETWTTPHLLTYALLGLLVGGIFADQRAAKDERLMAVIAMSRHLAPPEGLTADQKLRAALRETGFKPEAVEEALNGRSKR